MVKEPISVRAQMTHILRLLQNQSQCKFTQLFSRNDSLTLVVTTFIALLELAKEGLIQIQQNSNDEPILIQTINH